MRDLEARENWIQARIDELMDDEDWMQDWEMRRSNFTAFESAAKQAEREHAAIMADLEEERINLHRGHHEF